MFAKVLLIPAPAMKGMARAVSSITLPFSLGKRLSRDCEAL